MQLTFFEHPILNSPYAYPGRHWELDADGQPTNRLIESRRRSDLITPVPKAKKRKAPKGPTSAGRAGADGRRRRPQHGRAEVRPHTDHQRAARLCGHLARAAEPAAVAGHARDRAPAAALAAPPVSGRPALLLPDRSGRDSDLADRSRPQARGVGQEVPRAPGRRQCDVQPGPVPHRAEAGHRRRQDHRHGHAHRLADRERGAPPGQQAIHARLPRRGTRPDHQGPPARAAAAGPGQLLRQPRDRARRHARRHQARRHRDHQLSRLQAARDLRHHCRWPGVASKAEAHRFRPWKPKGRCCSV